MDILKAIGNFFNNIFNGLIDWVLELLNGIFGGLGELIGAWLISRGITIEIPAMAFDILDEITVGIGYILPINALMPIVYLWLSFYVAKIIFAVYSIIANTVIKRVSIKV